MDILILGNGFDLAHDLDTKYSDFLDYCRAQYNRIRVYKPTDFYYTNLWLRHFITVQNKMGDTWIDLEQEIYKVIQHISTLPIINNTDCQRLFKLSFNNSQFNFYDLKRYLEEPMIRDSLREGYVRCQPYNELQYIIYFSSPKGVIDFLYNQLREFTKAFEEYLLNNVLANINAESKFKLSLKSIGVTEGNKDVHILNFNYTNTCQRFYNSKFSEYCNLKIKPVFVHGEAKRGEECNLVLGTQSFDITTFGSNTATWFNIFKKHYQRHKYETIEPYQDLLRKIKKSRSIPVFHIIGHSLDSTDENILKHVLLANSDAKINVYYHNEEAQDRLMKKINDIIGEEEVMAKVRFINQHDTKRGILIPQRESALQLS